MELLSDVFLITAWFFVGYTVWPKIGELNDIREGAKQLFGARR